MHVSNKAVFREALVHCFCPKPAAPARRCVCCTEAVAEAEPVETEGKEPDPVEPVPVEVVVAKEPEPVENGSTDPEPVAVGVKEQVEPEVKEEAPCSPPPPGKYWNTQSLAFYSRNSRCLLLF